MICVSGKTRPMGSNQAAPAALAKIRLLLLPSGPDKIHGMTPHGTQSSSPTDWMIIAHRPRKCKRFFAPPVSASKNPRPSLTARARLCRMDADEG